MKNKLIAMGIFLGLTTSSVMAVDNVGGCGWGSKVFAGQKGIFPQVLAITTNGTSGNQTFGISSGTSGCTQDGVVRSNWRTAMFIGNNMNRLARDMSVGGGESLECLAVLLKVSESDKELFVNTLHQNFTSIFSSEEVRSEEVQVNIKNVLLSSEELSKYSARV